MRERDWVALTLWGEARGEGLLGLLAVAAVLHNRLRSGRWGSSYQAVATAPWQFSCWNKRDPNRPRLDAFVARVNAGENLAEQDTVLARCYWVADALLLRAFPSGMFPSPVAKATHYFAATLPKPPKWAATGVLVATIDKHHFFEGVK
jgi:N-acetylmuramoyl-L-alanine amidase